MATARAIFQAHVDALQAESLPFVFQWSLPTAVLKRETLAWGPGDTTLTLPSGATFVIVNPPAATTATLKTKGNAGDTGWEISHSTPTILTVAGTQSRILTASVAVTGIEITYL